MFHVLEHLPDPRAYLDAARELLAPDGRLMVQVPNAACWQFRILRGWWTGADIPRHLFDFRDRDLEKLLESRGFEVLRRKYFSLRDNPAGLASSIAPWLDPMARRLRQASGGAAGQTHGISASPAPVGAAAPTPEHPFGRLAKDLAYFALVLAALGPAALEAACRAGSTVMMEARPR
jgi:SAM-dependent methyltransferase